ncbi:MULTISPECIES: Kiwa anti-phage protein KwaB-like domain-containing protein [Halomonadaceae]|uniref:Kiwa anti-phage protein KwaB-like domain-containing protein n=1 Tax=Halomonadaceae TaxID=28256 RepID=UPI001597C421|nr:MULTISPECIES: Kiwa anti-phage protein KwaB-like domain-containing protein [Halomonas]QJQ96272.1 DUF4868 domain-containing protein [Halomonas sp. PA5]
MVDNFKQLKEFDFEGSVVSLWIFKSGADVKNKNLPRYTGRWVETGEELDENLIEVVRDEIDKVEEIKEFQTLAQNHETSALYISYEETHVGLILDACREKHDKKRIMKVKDIQNAKFYVVVYVKNGQTVYGLKQTSSSWKGIKRKTLFNVNFNGEELEIEQDNSFYMSKNFDVLVFGDSIFALDKNRCETILNYKKAHIKNFDALCADKEFVSLFDDLALIEEYVGNNKIHLRRAAVIQEKGYYRDPLFIQSLIDNLERLKFQIKVSDDGKIVVSKEACRDIFQALLDHRLISHYGDKAYDVQETTDV